MSITRTDYAHPYRPWPVRALNGAASALRLDGRPRLDRAALIAAAQRAEGLTDFGAPTLDPLDVLLPSIEAEAHLHALGRRITFDRLVGVLRNRLRAQALFQATPAILERPVRAPIVITGLQRTGTTFLHRLIAADPGIRALRSWEALDPVPRPGSADGDTARRRRMARFAESGLRWMAPDFFAVHPVEADAPEEEVLLLDQSLLSTVPEATLRVPTFSAWLESQDQRPAYDTLRRLLQLLDAGERRWVLKTPHHLEWLDTLLDVFPDAIIVMTHRDPVTTLASFCSMVAHGRGVMSDAVDPAEIGGEWLRKVGRMMDRALDTRSRRGGTFVDVQYADLMRDPMGEVARIYAAAGQALTPEARAAMEELRTTQTQDKHGRHAYALADFGLTDAMVAERFSAYRHRFGLVKPPPKDQ